MPQGKRAFSSSLITNNEQEREEDRDRGGSHVVFVLIM